MTCKRGPGEIRGARIRVGFAVVFALGPSCGDTTDDQVDSAAATTGVNGESGGEDECPTTTSGEDRDTPQLCADYLEKAKLCTGMSDPPACAMTVEDVCEVEFDVAEETSPACVNAYTGYYSCLVAARCEALLDASACTAEAQSVSDACASG